MLRNHRQLSFKILASYFLLLTSYFFSHTCYLLPYTVGHAYAQSPGSEDTSRLEKGKALLKGGDYNGALSILAEAAVDEPENSVIYNYIGEAYYRLKRYDDAVDALKKSIALNPDYITPHIGLGIVYETMERSEESIREFQEALRIGEATPDAPDVNFARERLKRIEVREHMRKGRGLVAQGKLKEAITEIESAVSKDTDNTSAHLLAGMVYKRLNKPKDSYNAFKRVIELQPGNLVARFNLGELHYSFGAFQEAIDEFREVIRLAPNSKEAKDAELLIISGEAGLNIRRYFEEASEAVKTEKYDAAEDTLNKILALQPDNSYALYNMGVVYYMTDRFEDALGVLIKSLEISPEDVQTRFRLAAVYDKLARFEDALPEYEKVAESKSEIEEVKEARTRVEMLRRYLTVKKGVEKIELLIEGGDIEEALKEVEALLAEDDKNERAHLLLGRIHVKKGDTAKAHASVRRAISIKPDFWDAYILSGQISELQGKYSEAADVYKAVISDSPGTKQGLLATDLLKSIEIPLHFERARGFMEKGDFDGAIKEINLILEIAPDDPVALYNAGILYYRLDMFKKAEDYLKRAIGRNPEYIQAYLQLGLVYQSAERFDEAELEFRKVLSISEKGKEADVARARLGLISEEAAFLTHMKEANRRLKAGDYVGSKEELETIITIMPGNYVAYFQLGVVLMKMDLTEDAINALKRAVEIKPDYAVVHLFMAQLYEKDGLFKDARDAYGKASDFGAGTREGEMADISLRRLRNWRLSANMGHTIDSNISYGAKRRTGVSTGHGLNLSYGVLSTEKRRLTLSLSLNRSLSYASQLSGMNYEGGLNWNHKIRNIQSYGINTGYTYSTFEGTPSYKRLSYSVNTSLTPGTMPTSLSISYSFSTTDSFVNRASNAESHSVSFSTTQNLSLLSKVTGSYGVSSYINKDPLGSNYANRSHNLSLSYSRLIRPGLNAGASYGNSFINYSNPDSTTLFTAFRRNRSQSLGLNLTYQVSQNVSFSLNMSKVSATTNLAVPTAEERQKLEDILAAPIPVVGGGYKKETVTMGISVIF